jgi:ABC-type transport system involved in cytochrome c biogenesis ATPase subunit
MPNSAQPGEKEMSIAQTGVSQPVMPIRIDVVCNPGKKYKSIESMSWDAIPTLAIVTGLNGSGKTQLLELLAFKLTGTGQRQLGMLDGIEVAISGDNFSPDSIAYLPSRWDMTGVSDVGIPELQRAKNNLWVESQQAFDSFDMRTVTRHARIQAWTGGIKLDQPRFSECLGDDFAFMLEDGDAVAGLAYLFVAYRLQSAQEREQGLSQEAILEKLGPAPWVVINRDLQAADFPFLFVSPTDTAIASTYRLELQSRLSDARITPGDLSSGEKTLLVLVLWLYNAQQHGRFPKLLLLDEPDANLHPSMTRQFLNVLKNVLVDRYGVRVILTTHSPSTVALAPEGSVFEMSREHPRIRKSGSLAETVGLLTAGLVVVSPGTRIVLVEDETDVNFYESIRDLLSDYGPSRDPRAIRPAPSIIFAPSSRGTGPGKVGGGNTVVTAWVNKFDQPPLNEIVRGVIDRDVANCAANRIAVLGRYSIENYLLDPLVVFCLLSSVKLAPSVSGVSLSPGSEHLIRELPETSLSAVVAAIASMVEPRLRDLLATEKVMKTVTFTTGKTVEYPAWIIDRRGHDLLPVFQAAFGGVNVISPPRLDQSFRRLRLIPAELADIFDKLQR